MRALGLELAARGLAAVGEQVVVLAEGVQLHDEVARDLVPLRAQKVKGLSKSEKRLNVSPLQQDCRHHPAARGRTGSKRRQPASRRQPGTHELTG